jgi:hypothetical protein
VEFAASLHRPVRRAQRLLSEKTARMGDEGKAAKRGGAGGFAVCEAAFLCCASHSVASNSGPFAERLTRPFLQLAAEKLDALRDACPKPGIVWGNFEGEPLFILRDLRAAKAINARSEKLNSRSTQWLLPPLRRVPMLAPPRGDLHSGSSLQNPIKKMVASEEC